MTYTKPAIEVLGKATVVIEGSLNKTVHNFAETVTIKELRPAYELDE